MQDDDRRIGQPHYGHSDAPVSLLTPSEMRRAAAYLSGVMGLHSAAGKLIAEARRLELTAESLDQLATDLGRYLETEGLSEEEKQSLRDTITYSRGRAAFYRALTDAKVEPVPLLTPAEMRRAAAYLSGVMGMHHAAGRLLSLARLHEQREHERQQLAQLVRPS